MTANTSDTTNLTRGRSHFSAGSKLTGDLRVPGLIELLGHVDGKVSADAITIEESGSVDGELIATKVAIKGQFQGKIIGTSVSLHFSAKVSGEITSETLDIENGAQVNATCMVKKPA